MEERTEREKEQMKIAVAGTGYVGLSIATLLSQHHEVVAVDIIPEKVDFINRKKSPIQDEYIEVLIEKTDGEEWLLEIDKDMDEDLGIVFENGLMDDYKSCHNKCIFCFTTIDIADVKMVKKRNFISCFLCIFTFFCASYRCICI